MAGDKQDLAEALPCFVRSAADETRTADEFREACCVIARGARLQGDYVLFHKYVDKVIAEEGNSEICYELGVYYEEQGDLEEAAIWFYNAVYETGPVLCLRAGAEDSLEGLIRCYRGLGLEEQVQIYDRELRSLKDSYTQNKE